MSDIIKGKLKADQPLVEFDPLGRTTRRVNDGISAVKPTLNLELFLRVTDSGAWWKELLNVVKCLNL